MNLEKFRKIVEIDGLENLENALKQGKGVILLAMHFGSWEMANLLSATLGHPYKVLVKPQTKYSRLDDLLNSYRQCGGSVVLERGMGTRGFLKSLKDNEVVALVVDQGGRDGVLTPFFGREASMSVGAVRVGLKLGVPICFAVIARTGGERHRMIMNPPLDLVETGDAQKDLAANLAKIAGQMEKYIRAWPAEYMWFYKIWKYSKDSMISIITDGTTGHLRQSEAVAGLLRTVLAERGVTTQLPVLSVKFKSAFLGKLLMALCLIADLFGRRGRLGLLRLCLTPDSFRQVMSVNPEFIISAGSSIAAVNYLLSKEHDAKSIVILKPSILNMRRFDLVLLPSHDRIFGRHPENVVITHGAPNLVMDSYLREQTEGLFKRYSHLKNGDNFKIGILLGGDTKDFVLTEQRIRVFLHQVMEAAEETQADILLTTSRRTSAKIENLVMRELKKYNRCKFLIIANREAVPEAVGGILGLCDVVIVSGDSISMISEAASSGKKVIVFPVDHNKGLAFEKTKHGRFLDRLNSEGYVLSSDVKNIKDSLYKLIKNKVQTKRLNDNAVVTDGLKRLI
jgi:mitochondrial fission protein ELM1